MSHAALDQAVRKLEEHCQTYTGGEYRDKTFRYRLLRPSPIEPGRKYPVVLYLHGAGERGDDNRSHLKYLPAWMAKPAYQQRFPCFLVAPQCRQDRKWVEVDWSSSTSAMPTEANDQTKVVLAILDSVLERYPIDPARQYLTGISMGGYACWDLATRYPGRFAAVVPICGGGDETKASLLVGTCIWAVHGDQDPAVPVVRSRRMVQAVREAGGDLMYTELAGVPHDSWTPTYTDPDGVLTWMFEQSRAK